jgi:hypothetical protein
VFATDDYPHRTTRQRFNEVGDAINAQIARAAGNVGIPSLTKEVFDAFSGHEACSPDEWISTLSMHPNAAGHRASAQVVANGVPAAPTRIGVVNDGAEPPSDPVPVDEEQPTPPPSEEEQPPAPAGGWDEQPPPPSDDQGLAPAAGWERAAPPPPSEEEQAPAPAGGWDEQPPPPASEDEQENASE